MRIHFIAIGGAAMHSLAIAMHLKGEQVTGSDDEVFDPAKTQLAKAGLLPAETGWFPDRIFGRHNMQNATGARLVCRHLGLTDTQFFEAIKHFPGAGKRLQLLGQNGKTAIYLDFAHSPSKVEATVKAVREQYAGRRLVACLELHTYSSLNRNFLVNYSQTLDQADDAAVFYNPQTIVHKRLEMISTDEVKHAFGKKDLKVFTARDELESFLYSATQENTVLLLMSSGNFSGIDFKELSASILRRKT